MTVLQGPTLKRQVVILAGGLGTRLRPITEKMPKPMAPVMGEPFLHWQLKDLKRQGYQRVLLLTAYLGEQIEQHFGDGSKYGMQITYSREPSPLGTGGALRHALSKLENEFFLLNGDSFLMAPLDQMALTFHKSTCSAMISTYSHQPTHPPMPVIPNLECQGGRVIRYEKDAGPEKGFHQIDSGVYLLKRSILGSRPEGIFALADLWPPLIAEGSLAAFGVDDRFYDIGTMDRLAEFESAIRAGF